ncbi:ATP-binding cassette domain-containing protein [Pimelobacter simplex]|uniref:ATP-binding cassette domain-containing protein n=1 Tax=Nocardioides simplex TaxID=2045 RepID=UPI001C202728|nr:ATP-binding cassette domain-containing protein [Pimelobacter simplex]
MAGSGTAHLRPDAERVLVVDDLVVEYPAGRGKVHAVSGLSLDLLPGETLGILGESGCGKSSAGRAVMQLPAPTSGSVRLGDVELTGLRARRMRAARSRMQLVLQDPVSALNPRRRGRTSSSRGWRSGAGGRASATPSSTSCCRRWASTRRPCASGVPTSCPAGSASGCASPARSRSIPTC